MIQCDILVVNETTLLVCAPTSISPPPLSPPAKTTTKEGIRPESLVHSFPLYLCRRCPKHRQRYRDPIGHPMIHSIDGAPRSNSKRQTPAMRRLPIPWYLLGSVLVRCPKQGVSTFAPPRPQLTYSHGIPSFLTRRHPAT